MSIEIEVLVRKLMVSWSRAMLAEGGTAYAA